MRTGLIRIMAIVVLTIVAACSPEFIDQPDRLAISADTNVRSGPGMDYKIIGTLKAGTRILLLASQNDWHRVEMPDGRTGWIFHGVARLVGSEKVVIMRDTRVRRGPGDEFSAFAIVKKGKQLDSRGERGNWYLVDLVPGKSGWIKKSDAEKSSHRNLTVTMSAKVHQSPDIRSKVMINVNPGSELVYLGKQGEFYQIRLSGGDTGWLHESAVKPIQERTIRVKEKTYVRRGANVGYGVSDTVDVGMRLTLLAEKDNWYEVRTPTGTKGWIYKDFVTTIMSKGELVAEERPVFLMTNQDCNVRQGWGTNWQRIDRLKKGTLVMKIGQKDDWLRVKMPNEKIGWIRQDLLDFDVTVLITLLECNIRMGYGTNFMIKTRVPGYTPLVRISEQQGWTRVYLTDSEIGWIRNDLFAPLDSLLFANQDCNVRKGPSTQHARIKRIDYGTPVYYLGKEKNWYKIRLVDNREIGYIRDDLLNQTGNEFVANDRINVYKGASTDYAVIGTLPVRTRLKKMEQNENFFRVQLDDGRDGWVEKDKVSYSFYPAPNYRLSTGTGSTFAGQTAVTSIASATPAVVSSGDGYDSQQTSAMKDLSQKDVTKVAINLRTQPDTSSSIITNIPPGNTLYQIKQSGEWWEVMTVDGTYGWVHQMAFGTPATKTLYAATAANVRYGPSTNYRIVATVRKGEMLTRLDKRDNWYNVRLPDNSTGWIRQDLVDEYRIAPTIDHSIVPEPAYSTAITVAETKLYDGPSYSYPIRRNIHINTIVTIIGRYQKWSQVELNDGTTGWIANDDIREKFHSKLIAVNDADVRANAATQSEVVDRVKKGEFFRPFEEKNGWFRIIHHEKTGWISSRDVLKLKYPPVYVNTEEVNIRRLPDINSKKIGIEKEGAKLIPTDDHERWLFVRLPRGDRGWIHKDLVNRQKYPWIKIVRDAEVYQKPTAGSILRGRVTRGEKYLALDKNDNWYKMALRSGDIAWIYAGFVEEEVLGTQLLRDDSNLRMGPGQDYEIVSQVKKGQQVKWLAKEGNWWQIQINGNLTGWIRAEEAKELPMKELTANRNDVAYKLPGTNHPSVGRVVKNQKFTPLEKQGSWYKVQLANGVIGWVHSDVFDAPKSRLVFTLDVATLYKSPSTSSSVVQKIEPATDLYILGSEGNWYYVETKNERLRGYLRKELVFE
ncbi:MAG TPA: hypothetical protein ENN22_05970 [bacterium]|nr:hypothetical protein [bacterium]